jgi:hypothetical protein
VHLLIHVAEERKRGGKNKDVRGGEQAEQQNDFALGRAGPGGRFVHRQMVGFLPADGNAFCRLAEKNSFV